MPSDAPDIPALLHDVSAGGSRKALTKLLSLGEAALPSVRKGLEHPSWKVRRDCLRFLDHHIDPESARLVLERLHDEQPEVRKWAAHALGCDHCKSGAERGIDPVPSLIDVVRNDPSLRVRRSAVVALAWTLPSDVRIRAFLTSLLESETDAKIRLHAAGGAARYSETASAD